MSWKQLLANKQIQIHKTNEQEISALKAVVNRDLVDAALPDLSADRQFATAYNAMLQLAKIVIAKSGYRVLARTGHHATTIEALKLAMGVQIDDLAAYLDMCRRKRNLVEYDYANIISEAEANEILLKSREFRNIVAEWLPSAQQ